MARKKLLTNDEKIKQLMKELDMLEMSILRERILKIAEITLADIRKNPKNYDNPIFNHTYYVSWANKVIDTLGFED